MQNKTQTASNPLIQEPSKKVNHVAVELPGPQAKTPQSFEAAQGLLQRAAKQLKIWEQPEEASQDRVAELIAEIDIACFEKCVVYDVPIEHDFTQRIQLMNITKMKDVESRLLPTTSRLAAKYLGWLHSWLGTDTPNPLRHWLRELEIDIHDRYKNHPAHRLFRAAEQQVFIYVSLYASALLAWVKDFCAVLPFDAFATACAVSGQRLPRELCKRLGEQRDELLVWEAVMEIIERGFLHDSVLPAEWRHLLDRDQLHFQVADRRAKRCQRIDANVLESAESMDLARVKVKILLDTVRAKATLAHCHQLLYLLAEARLTLAQDLDHWGKLIGMSANLAVRSDGLSEREPRVVRSAQTETEPHKSPSAHHGTRRKGRKPRREK